MHTISYLVIFAHPFEFNLRSDALTLRLHLGLVLRGAVGAEPCRKIRAAQSGPFPPFIILRSRSTGVIHTGHGPPIVRVLRVHAIPPSIESSISAFGNAVTQNTSSANGFNSTGFFLASFVTGKCFLKTLISSSRLLISSCLSPSARAQSSQLPFGTT